MNIDPGSDAAADEGGERILVVDDDEFVRKALERSLKRLGYEVLLAQDGEDGLKKAVELTPHVLITDLRMPNMDGHTLVRRLSSHDLDTVVVVISGNGTMDDVVDVLRGGAVDYLKKPWSPSELSAAMGRAIEIHEKRRGQRGRASTPPPEPAAQATPSFSAPPAPAAVHPSDGPPTEPMRRPDTPRPAAREQPTATQVDPTFASILEQLRRGTIALPPVPSVVMQLRALVYKPETNLDEVVALIERDQRLCAEVLRIAAHVRYISADRSPVSIRTAVTRIGFRQVQSLVETIFLRGAYQVKEPELRALQQRIWRFSVARALAMRSLAEAAAASFKLDAEKGYVAGLMADVGASFLVWTAAEKARFANKPAPGSQAVLAAIRTQHQEIGAALLKGWEMDPTVVELARQHHQAVLSAAKEPYWALAVLATSVANELAPGDDLTGEPLDPGLVNRCGAELRVGTSVSRNVSRLLAGEFEGILGSLG